MNTDISQTDPDLTDHNLLTDISLFLDISGKKREKQWRDKIREELVQEYLEQESKPKNPLKSILGKLMKR